MVVELFKSLGYSYKVGRVVRSSSKKGNQAAGGVRSVKFKMSNISGNSNTDCVPFV